METVEASVMWDGPERDIITIFREPTPPLWQADAADDDAISVLHALDEQEQETGEIAGIEVLGFLAFERWDGMPDLPILWQLPDCEPLPLVDLLKRKQQELRQRHKVRGAA